MFLVCAFFFRFRKTFTKWGQKRNKFWKRNKQSMRYIAQLAQRKRER